MDQIPAESWRQTCLEILGDQFCDSVADTFCQIDENQIEKFSDYLHDVLEGEISESDSWRWPSLHALSRELVTGLDEEDRRFVVETAILESCGLYG